jgi:tetratricopeptide (TPR) repeat protein
MPNRDLALTALQDRLSRADAQRDPTLLFTRDAELIAADLAAATDTGTDLEAAGVLGSYHLRRYDWQCQEALPDGQGSDDLFAALVCFRAVYQSAPETVPEVAREILGDDAYAASLDAWIASRRSIDLTRAYEGSGHQNLPVLREAIAAGRTAVAATPEGDPDRPTRLTNLGIALQLLFERTEEPGVLSEMVQVSRDALAASSHDDDHAKYLTNVSAALLLQFRRTGDTNVLSEVVRVARDALAATPRDDPFRASRLANLASALKNLSEQTGDTDPLKEAIQVGRDALAACPQSDPERGTYLNNLGGALQLLSERTGDVSTLADAVQFGRDAVAATSDDHLYRPARLSNLSFGLQHLFGRTGETALLEEAVQVGRKAVAATLDDHPDRPGYQTVLVSALCRLSERTEDLGMLADAIAVGRAAEAASPRDRPDRAMCLYNLGYALQLRFELRLRFERTEDTGALAEAAEWFRKAGGSELAAVPVRIVAWRQAAVLTSLLGGRPLEALAAAEEAVKLLPQVTPRSLARPDREHRLGAAASLAGVAAAAAVAAGRPGRAVELLEQARGLLVADTVDARSSDLTRLRDGNPDLAREFEELRSRLDALDSPDPLSGLTGTGPGPGAEHVGQVARDLSRARRDAHAAWQDLITRIRGLDGFADFLAPLPIHRLAAQAHDGPVVFVSTSRTRCDALILTADPDTPVQVVPLANLTETAAMEQAGRLLAACGTVNDDTSNFGARSAAQDEILEALAWLWDTTTGPVLDALGHAATPRGGDSWPRVWWCPVGILAFLPLHAAGHHADRAAADPALAASPRTVFDRVISSYTTTLRGLAYARTHHQTPPATPVVIAVPDAPGVRPLPGVPKEVEALRKVLPDSLVLPNPTHKEVLAALPGHPVAHFACHGGADSTNPAASHLVLSDRHLTVTDISALRLTGGLAYLSACDTTVTSPSLSDEAVHITGAFHLAGYQHVIGTLWPVNDGTTARKTTEDFYQYLTCDGTTLPDTSRSAHALHHAIRHIRDRYPRTPTCWAAHTHTGT